MGTITRTFANNITTSGKFDAEDLTGTLPASNIANASCANVTDVPALTTVSTESSDPPSPDAGQMWYNTTSKQLKSFVLAAGTWASGGTLNTGRRGVGLGTLGTQTAALCVTGSLPPGSNTAAVESYNGSSWTEVSDVNTAVRYVAASGTQSSAIKYTGNADPQTVNAETWNGSSWTEVGNINNARSSVSGAGADSTTAIAMSGYNNPPGTLGFVETWNGSSWTETTNVNTARWGGASIGVRDNGLLTGGYNTAAQANTETWNGSAWTEVGDLNTAGYEGAGHGTTSDGLFSGGNRPGGKTEKWNGSAWTEVNDIGITHSAFGGGGTSSSAIIYGGNPAPYKSTSYEFTEANATRALAVGGQPSGY
tara:strand:+ start:108 stop:1205 length:1098 start_codon:yes stop_codon:yes gene_type:complete